MGHFDAYRDIIVKMTKCRTDVHTMTRRGRSDTPTGNRSKLLLVTRSSSELSAVVRDHIALECA